MLLFAITGATSFAIFSSKVQTFITHKIIEQISAQLNSDIKIGKVDIEFFNKIVLTDVLIKGQKNDTIWFTKLITANIDSLKIKDKRLILSELNFDNNKIAVEHDSLNHFNFSFIFDSLQRNDESSSLWKVYCNQFGFHNSKISYDNLVTKEEDDIFVYDINLNISEFENFKDSVQFKINSLNFNDGNKLYLEEFSADIITTNKLIEINNLNLKSKYSDISNSNVSIFLNKNNQNKNIEIDFELNNSEISFLELAELIPALKGMDQLVKISGRIYGDLNDLKGKNITINTAKNTKAVLDFYLNSIRDPENMYLFFDLKQAQTTFTDVSQFNLPNNSTVKNIQFPENFYDAGILSFDGNFSGFVTDFVTFGTLKSEMGVITTDISVNPDKNGKIRFRGNISTTNFNIGELINDSILGNVTFSGKVDGDYSKTDQALAGYLKGDISEIEANNYRYKNIKLEGLLADKMFDGLFIINDSNLQSTFLGRFDLNSEIPIFDFQLDLDKALPGNLNLGDNFPDAEIAFKMKAKFTGDKLDNVKGSVVVNDGFYKNRNGQIDFKDIELKSIPDDSVKTLTFTSDFFDIEIDGKYHFQSILNTFKKDINKFIPALKYEVQENEQSNIFDFRLIANNLDQLTKVFAPNFKFETPFLLYGKVDSENSDIELAGSIPGLIYNSFLIRNIFLNNKVIDNKYSSKVRFGEIQHKKGYKLYDFTFESIAADNIVDNIIQWDNNPDSTSSSTIKTKSLFSVSDTSNQLIVNIEGFPTDFYIADTVWHLNSFTSVLNRSEIEINNLKVFNNKQSLSVNGNLAKRQSELMTMEFDNIDLSYLEKYLDRNLYLNGTINGSIGVSGYYKQPAILSNIKIDNLRLRDHIFGDVIFLNTWDNEKATINTELTINSGNRQNLYASGFYHPETNELKYSVNADSLSAAFLNAIIRDNLSNFHGNLSGSLKVSGTLDKIAMNGAIMVANAGLTVDYINVHYNFDDLVYFKSDTIEFNKIKIFDVYNNSGELDGSLIHRNFMDMRYNLSVNSSKILALNTTSVHNAQFYGEVFGDGKFTIEGRKRTVNLTGSASTLSGTNLNISMEYEDNAKQYDFIKFVTTESNEVEKLFFDKDDKGELTLKLTVEATPEAKVQLIYNSQIGDIIKAQGEGILLFEMNKDGDISLSGDYSVVEGDYLFTLKNVLNKRFIIEQGGSVIWSGDPYNAIIDLTAVYKLKPALYDLMMESYLIPIEDIYQRIPVECKILLSEDLTNPIINFEIDFPEENESLKGILQQFINTEEELNKQILSLIVLGKFYTPEYLRGQYESQNPNTLGNTASELFSNQLSNWLSQIHSNVDVGFNYRPGNDITNDEIELALSTQIFNDRVLLNGNIGNNVNPESTNSSQIVGDFDIKVKLVPSGKIMFKAFNRSNNDLIYDTAPYTQGVGFSFKEEYNSFIELMKKIGAIFKKKKTTDS